MVFALVATTWLTIRLFTRQPRHSYSVVVYHCVKYIQSSHDQGIRQSNSVCFWILRHFIPILHYLERQSVKTKALMIIFIVIHNRHWLTRHSREVVTRPLVIDWLKSVSRRHQHRYSQSKHTDVGDRNNSLHHVWIWIIHAHPSFVDREGRKEI